LKISRQRICSIRPATPESTSGSRSTAQPGSIPDTNTDVPPPVLHAVSIRVRRSAGTEGGCKSRYTPDDTTFAPASRHRTMSPIASSGRVSAVAAYATASGRSASAAATSSVARTPVGAMPASSPASRPTFAGVETITPTSSSPRLAHTARIAGLPTLPVPQTTTRRVIGPP
jgi:hypothetical protein